MPAVAATGGRPAAASLLLLSLQLLLALALLLLGCGEECPAEGACLVLLCYCLFTLCAQLVVAALQVGLEHWLCGHENSAGTAPGVRHACMLTKMRPGVGGSKSA
jgi:hypothetical protein